MTTSLANNCSDSRATLFNLPLLAVLVSDVTGGIDVEDFVDVGEDFVDVGEDFVDVGEDFVDIDDDFVVKVVAVDGDVVDDDDVGNVFFVESITVVVACVVPE